MTIALQLMAAIRGTASKLTDAGSPTLAIAEALTKNITNGTGIDQANLHYIKDFNIAASGNLQVDLAGALTDDLGQAAVFTKVKAVLLITDATNVNNVVYGNDTNPFVGPLSAGTVTITVPPGNMVLLTNFSAAGWTVTPTTGDIIKLTNSGAGSAVTGTLVVIGLS